MLLDSCNRHQSSWKFGEQHPKKNSLFSVWRSDTAHPGIALCVLNEGYLDIGEVICSLVIGGQHSHKCWRHKLLKGTTCSSLLTPVSFTSYSWHPFFLVVLSRYWHPEMFERPLKGAFWTGLEGLQAVVGCSPWQYTILYELFYWEPMGFGSVDIMHNIFWVSTKILLSNTSKFPKLEQLWKHWRTGGHFRMTLHPLLLHLQLPPLPPIQVHHSHHLNATIPTIPNPQHVLIYIVQGHLLVAPIAQSGVKTKKQLEQTLKHHQNLQDFCHHHHLLESFQLPQLMSCICFNTESRMQ